MLVRGWRNRLRHNRDMPEEGQARSGGEDSLKQTGRGVFSLFDCHMSIRSAPLTVQNLDQFIDLLAAFLERSVVESVGDATLQMLAQHFLFHPIKGSARGIDLGQYVDAIAVFRNHIAHAAHLPLDPGETVQTAFLGFHIHA